MCFKRFLFANFDKIKNNFPYKEKDFVISFFFGYQSQNTYLYTKIKSIQATAQYQETISREQAKTS